MANRIFILFISLCAIFIYFITDYRPIPEDQNRGKIGQPKEGTIDSYDVNGNIKTRVNYLNGKKHGTSYLYYADGQVQLAMPYVHGLRHGTSIKYFKEGSIYAETPYEYDLLEGTRITYYRNGNVKARIPYHRNMPGTGLEEFTLNARKITPPNVTYLRKGDELIFSTDPGCQNTTFYIGKLDDNQYLNKNDNLIEILPMRNESFVLNLEVFTPSYLRFQDIICECKSKLGNPYVLRVDVEI
jgi:antitoxin component YwqK of YwqJK toxin-antitoxin module